MSNIKMIESYPLHITLWVYYYIINITAYTTGVSCFLKREIVEESCTEAELFLQGFCDSTVDISGFIVIESMDS